MPDLLRQEIATSANTLVVKVGTRVLTDADGRLDQQRIARLASEISQVRETGKRVILVSSGAVGAGMEALGLDRRPTDLARLQAVAAVGQTKLTEAYDRTFRIHDRHAAQVLLTAEDFDDRARYLNVRNTLLSLVELGAIPVINENDTVSVDELQTTFGDNDRLAAMVTTLLRSPLLVILSDVDGLYDGDPQAEQTEQIPLVTELNDKILAYAQPSMSGKISTTQSMHNGESPGTADSAPMLSKGGMSSKLRAAQIVTQTGENVIIASGRDEHVLAQILQGEVVGTLFLAQGRAVSPKKRWIGFSVQPRGQLHLDAGACRAISQHGRSLLSIGVTDSAGEFTKGDVVSIFSPDGREIARGLTNYHAGDLRRIRGLNSNRIAVVLGYCPYEEVIHRDNLVVL